MTLLQFWNFIPVGYTLMVLLVLYPNLNPSSLYPNFDPLY